MKLSEIIFPTIILGITILPLISSNDVSYTEYYPTASWGVSHNLVQGRISDGDRLLHTQIIRANWKLFRKTSVDFRYPLSGSSYFPSSYPRAFINYISVNDLRTDGTGGYPSIIYGGVGRNEVNVRLTSQFNRGFEFNITIYGVYR